MIDKINNILLIIFIILLIFCISFYLYNGTNITNIIKNEQFDNILDNKTVLLELIKEAKLNATKIIKEKFSIDESQILQSNAINYINNINTIQSWLDNSYNGEYGIMAKLQTELKNASDIRKANKNAILTLLTNIYVISYINYVNKQNAESYKMYAKYNDAIKNKYYNQYLK